MSNKLLFILLSIASFLFWLFSLLTFFQANKQPQSFTIPFLLHTASIFLLHFSFQIRKKNDSIHFKNTDVLWTSILMPFIGVLFYLIFRNNLEKISTSSFLQEYQDHISYSIQMDTLLPDQKYRDRIVEEKSNLQAYVDILSSPNSEDEKIAVIDALTSIKNRRAIELIRKAQKDPSPEVSYVAATAIMKIENPILDEISFWKKQLSNDNQDGHAWLKLGILYDNYCFLGILDELNYQFYLGQALDCFLKAQKILPNNKDILLNLGRTYIRLDQPNNAIPIFEKLIHENPHDSNGYIWKAETLFRLNQFDQLSDFLKHVEQKDLDHWQQFESIRAVWT